jgi:hypothetical protein
MNARRIAKAMELVAQENSRIEGNRLAVEAARKAGAAARRRQTVTDLNSGLSTASAAITIGATLIGIGSGIAQTRKLNAMLEPEVRTMTAAERLADDRNTEVQSVLAEQSATRAARKAKKAAKRAKEAQVSWNIIQAQLRQAEEAYAAAVETSAKVTTLHQGSI